MTANSLIQLLVMLWLAAACGCSVLDLRGKLSQLSSDEKPQVPTRMVEVWTNEILTEPGLPGVRGFAGRVMFHNGEDTAPVKVDGTFVVLAFDEADAENGFTAPERKYVYLPEQLPKYYSKSELGHSYSFWLPWDEVGGPDRKICLIARFEPRKGAIVASKPCQKFLPGAAPRPGQLGSSSMRMAKRSAGGDVRQVSHETPLDESRQDESQREKPTESITSFTINVPRSFARADPPAGATPPEGGSPSGKPGESAVSGATASAATQAGERAAKSAAENARPGEARPGEPRAGSLDGAPPSDRYARRRFPARRVSIAPPRFDPVRRQPLPATPLSALPPTPRSGWQDPGPGWNEADESRSR